MPADPRDFLPPELAGQIDLRRLLGHTMNPPSFAGGAADEMLAALGSGLLAQAFDSLMIVNSSDWGFGFSGGDNQVNWTALILREPAEVTGVCFYLHTAGVYTANQNNKVGLYRVSPDETDLELVAQSSSDGNLFKTAGLVQKPFSAMDTFEAGLYYVALIYNNSAQTTEPRLAGATPVATALHSPLTGSLKRRLVIAAQNDLAASYSIASLSSGSAVFWAGLY